jgi:aminoglycoside 6'-N-acetyltransferase
MFERLPILLGRVRLRHLRADDLAAFHAYRSDPAVARYQGWNVMSLADAAAFIDEQSGMRNPAAWRQLAIAERASDALLGDLGVWLAHDASRAEFGVTMAPGAQRQRYATEAVSGLVDALFAATPVAEVVARADVRNVACLALLRRVGMRRVGSAQIDCKGEACTEHIFSLRRR